MLVFCVNLIRKWELIYVSSIPENNEIKTTYIFSDENRRFIYKFQLFL